MGCIRGRGMKMISFRFFTLGQIVIFLRNSVLDVISSEASANLYRSVRPVDLRVILIISLANTHNIRSFRK